MSQLSKIVIHRDDDDEPYCQFERRRGRGGLLTSTWAESDEPQKSVSRRLQAILDDLEAALMAEDYWGDDTESSASRQHFIDTGRYLPKRADLTHGLTCKGCNRTLTEVDSDKVRGYLGKEKGVKVYQDDHGLLTCAGLTPLGLHQPKERS